jgi:hypothetical protein
VKHEGEAFKTDPEAEAAANAWCALEENKGWEYSNKHKVEE